jgi:hypothetical protein
MAKGVIKFVMEMSYCFFIGILEVTCPEISYSICPFFKVSFNFM